MDLRTRLTSHVFRYDEASLVSAIGKPSPLAKDLNDKLAAEQQRLERLLPDPPPGYHWVWEIQTSQDNARFFGSVQYRVVYKLQEF
ncbi:hypothetical protein PBI_RACCOON_44 [Microbacterium phage Raccoon]|jgi:hypothetical protein|uniref:Uncharacterized protein n=2 Tax=Ilzatvirus hamlet TaxID=2560591 RepID=A0A2L0HMF3_9CAUD|nr:hypothetical protein FDJ35_gp44 [Microbacterium phage Hamlet]AUX82880.1 hypothetical protein PBI_HAMLET_44 [Microbacterium phage Hamlet]AUX83257.1 hypothetical protein PBI_RACCOON_44 [Microbacterium phage Raccoon]